MIDSIRFTSFKALRNTTLPLSPCTILVGPNGSGKTTVLQALEAISGARHFGLEEVVTADLRADDAAKVEVRLIWSEPHVGVESIARWEKRDKGPAVGRDDNAGAQDPELIGQRIARIRVYSFDANALAAPVELHQNIELASNGAGLAGVLDSLRDREPERFEALNGELGEWLPEYDRVSFELDADGRRLIFLRTREGHHKIAAVDVSDGTLHAIALLTLAYSPAPPPLLALEEPDRSIHPRLLRRVQDAIYRLSHPESCGENRDPVQVIATTHSPYFLDLFKDHPEEVVIANKVGQDVKFERLSEQPRIQETLEDAQLGDIWYTGILGGVPCEP